MRNKTTSIKRPEGHAAADEGRSTLGDYTRAIPVDKRISRRPQLAMFAGLFVLFVVVVALVAVFILPINTWREQDRALRVNQEQLKELLNANGEREAEVTNLETDAGIRDAANQELGYVPTSTKGITIAALPELPTNLPNGWPYNVSDQILAVRRAESSAPSAD